MKRFSLVALALLIAFSLSGCGGVLADLPGFRNPPPPRANLPRAVVDEVRGEKVFIRARGGQEVWDTVYEALDQLLNNF